MYKCPGCGAPLRFDPDTQKVVCDHCGRHMEADDPQITELNEAAAQGEVGANMQSDDGTYTAFVYCCPNCGAKLMSTEETAVTFCSFCGSNVVLEERLEQEIAPDIVIPFKVSKKACEGAYKKIMRRAFYAPEWMRKDTQIERFRGIYMPYWVYSFKAQGQMHAKGSVSHRVGDYIEKDHYDVSSNVDGYFGGVSYDASASFSDTMSEAVAPFQSSEKKPFRKPYLSGFYADVTDVRASVYADDAEKIARRYFANQAVNDYEYSRHGVERSKIEDAVPVEQCANMKGYYPVWFLANRSKNGAHVSYAVVNGQTGKAVADLPVSFWKYILFTLLLAIPIGLLLWQLVVNSSELSLSPKTIIFFMAVISGIMLFMLTRSLDKAYQRQYSYDDKGYMYYHTGSGSRLMLKAPKSERWAVKWKPFANIAMAVIMFIWGPIVDVYYYVVAGLGLIFLLWSVLDLVKLHNRLAEKMPP